MRLGLFTEAGKVLNTAQHKGLLDISDTDKSQPFEIRILDNSTLRASASFALVLNPTCCYSCRTTDSQLQLLQSPRTHCAACTELQTPKRTFKPFVMSALQVQFIMVRVALIIKNGLERGTIFDRWVHTAPGVMLDKCEDLESVYQWMSQMDKKKIARDEHTYD
eukprot:COSAG02_NODE_1132_length_14392_cov_7.068910_11_plen_164_part_00